MAITKDKQEEALAEKFLSNSETIKLLKETPHKERLEIMKYGINRLQPKTPREFAQEFLKLATLYPEVITAMDISKIINHIDIEEEEV